MRAFRFQTSQFWKDKICAKCQIFNIFWWFSNTVFSSVCPSFTAFSSSKISHGSNFAHSFGYLDGSLDAFLNYTHVRFGWIVENFVKPSAFFVFLVWYYIFGCCFWYFLGFIPIMNCHSELEQSDENLRCERNFIPDFGIFLLQNYYYHFFTDAKNQKEMKR